MRERLLRCFIVTVLCSVASGLVPSRANADLGTCSAFDGNQPHQGGAETAVTSSTRGVFGIITTRLPDLCNAPIPINPISGSLDSGSTVYVMITNYSDGIPNWYQMGYNRVPGDSCSHAYMQWLPSSGTGVYAVGPCVTAGVKYRYGMKKYQDDLGYYWNSYVLKDADGILFWDSPGDPVSLGFTAAAAEYSAEVINERDQTGGGNAARGLLENAVWYDANLNIVYADIPAADRFCQNCNPSTNGFPVGPYNTRWLTNKTFEVWTDGF
jgi:hypothetical protein